MSLQFILGGSGSGKSTYLFQKIIERSEKEKNRNFFLIVPDQFTMQTQLDIVNRHPKGGIMNIDVLSFSRLSYRILEETGGGGKPVLDDTGKSLVLRRVAGELEGELPVLGSNLKKLGYIHEVKSAISEFMQYGIGEKELEGILSFSQKRGGLYGKLKDLSVLYGGFKEYLRDRYLTTEETYDRLALQLQKSKLIRDSVVILDGFTGFTPVQNKVIRQLLLLSSETYITLTLDYGDSQQKVVSDNHLFSFTAKTLHSLKKIAEESGVEIKEDFVIPTRGVRFGEQKELVHLEKQLFRYPQKSFSEPVKNISFYVAENMEEEVRHTCRRIRKLLEEGYSYRDIAVITGDLGEYASMVEELFEQYNIPFFLDETKGITLNPFIEYIRAAIAVVVKNYSYDAIFHYLRSGMAAMDREQIDQLENYCLAYGIKGKKAWSTVFLQKDLKEEEIQMLNQLREQLAEEFQVLKPGKQKVEKQIHQLYTFLTNNQSQEKLREFEKYFGEQKEKSKEKEYQQIYSLVMDLLEQILELLGEEVLSWEELGQILDAGFGEIQVGIIPQAVDQVVVGNMERTRLKQVKALFFLGMNEGKVPRNTSKGGILSDLDREFLAESEWELAPTPRQQLFIQKFYFYLMVTKPSHRLFLSYAVLNSEGKSMKPSYFLEQVKALFPKCEEEKGENSKQPVTFGEARMAAAGLMAKLSNEKVEEREKLFLSALLPLIKEENQEWWENLWEAAYYHYQPVKISKEAAKALYGAVIYSSVSRLEKMAACAFAHYLQYGIQLKEREEYSFEAVDTGNIFHGVLEEFAGNLAQYNYTWLDFPLEEGRRILRETLEAYAITYGNTIMFSSARNVYGMKKIERILWRTVRTLQYQLQKGKFLPESFEISFSAMEDLDSISLTLSEEEKIRLGGRIDRIDTYREKENLYVKVVDYKSGNQSFQLAALYHGLQLQLVIYLNAAMELMQKKNPGMSVHPGAFLYYHVTDPMIEAKEELSEEEIEAAIRRELRGSGIINARQEVIDGMDKTHAAKSEVAHIEYKKDGELSARSQVMSEEEIGLLQKFASKKAEELGQRIMAGEIGKQPVVMKNRDACTFCSFRQICGFDQRLPGFEKRILEEPENEEILLMMDKMVEEEKGEFYRKPEAGHRSEE
ncbi:MAG: helicase-exonuclease AddAB subunit AddB [Lachnospiraceae bacterium]|nr:helicase-exonuclease AddAB subunit AddB [Lachnospiraceae bacterium]